MIFNYTKLKSSIKFIYATAGGPLNSKKNNWGIKIFDPLAIVYSANEGGIF